MHSVLQTNDLFLSTTNLKLSALDHFLEDLNLTGFVRKILLELAQLLIPKLLKPAFLNSELRGELFVFRNESTHILKSRLKLLCLFVERLFHVFHLLIGTLVFFLTLLLSL